MNSKFLDLAFEYAMKAYDCNEVPIGAVIVKNGIVIGAGFNKKEMHNDVCAHAEIIAIKEASKYLNNWRLDNCDIYITLDPCPMCASAIKQSRIRNVYSALTNKDSNNYLIISKIFEKDLINPCVGFYTNFDSDKSKKILNSFFYKQRDK